VIAGCGLALVVGAIFFTGAVDFVRDRERFVSAIRDAGVWGPLAYVALMTALVAVGVPGVLFVIPAATIWPDPTAITLFLCGGLAASMVRFTFVRSIGRAWVEERLPERFRRWDLRLSRGGVGTVVVMRLLFNMAAPADWLIALSRIGTRDFVIGTIIGRIPIAVALVIVGGALLDRLTQVSGAALVVALITVGVGVWGQSFKRRRRLHQT
jgi:uncharacterized membrane protein YdjX (TVP38/TMEM64 family)